MGGHNANDVSMSAAGVSSGMVGRCSNKRRSVGGNVGRRHVCHAALHGAAFISVIATASLSTRVYGSASSVKDTDEAGAS